CGARKDCARSQMLSASLLIAAGPRNWAVGGHQVFGAWSTGRSRSPSVTGWAPVFRYGVRSFCLRWFNCATGFLRTCPGIVDAVSPSSGYTALHPTKRAGVNLLHLADAGPTRALE